MEDLAKWTDSPLWDDEPTKNHYQYPIALGTTEARVHGRRLAEGIPPEQVYELGGFVCAMSPESHQGPYRHAIDFLVPDGTPVFAALDGKVIEVQQHSASWGPTSAHRDTLNYLTIEHVSGEHSQYCHLAPFSVRQSGVTIGTKVKRGQQIALVGKTGWTDRDHLHFIVFKSAKNESPFSFKSLNIKFD